MWTLEDLTGRVFGRLTVVRLAPKRGRRTYWRCACECWQEIEVWAWNLKNGHIQSCGCLHRELMTAHGHARKRAHTREYTTWKSMWQRCANPKHTAFKYYGGRGIRVCKRWEVFENFLEDMGERPAGKTLDRKDNNAGYTPKNCRWATHKEQIHNRRAA